MEEAAAEGLIELRRISKLGYLHFWPSTLSAPLGGTCGAEISGRGQVKSIRRKMMLWLVIFCSVVSWDESLVV